MRKLVFLAVLAFVAVPAAFADDATTSSTANALCKQQRTTMGSKDFTSLYGGSSNAFGRCVSKVAGTLDSDHANAAKQCAAERADANFATTHDGKTFDQLYGSGKNGGNAFGKCVSTKAQALDQQNQQATLNAAKSCKSERTSMGAADFKTKYGGHANAFGKCVAKAAKANP